MGETLSLSLPMRTKTVPLRVVAHFWNVLLERGRGKGEAGILRAAGGDENNGVWGAAMEVWEGESIANSKFRISDFKDFKRGDFGVCAR